MTLEALKEELAARADVLLADLLGEPSSRSTREWRWGRKGSLSYRPDLGAFYDHERQKGGSLLDLIAEQRTCSFGQAVDFAREWLGGHVHIEPHPIAAVPSYRPDTLSAAKAIWSGARSIHGTAAGKYLGTRGVGQCMPKIPNIAKMVPAPAFEAVDAMAWWHWPALAFLLTTADDRASALQLVALHDDGRPVMHDGRKLKRTIGPMAGAAFRMPGSNCGALLLAEGPETGLACWQSTGFETWALCGSIARADLGSVPTGRPVVVCADDDPADAPAAAALHAATERWSEEGRAIHVAYPWPERRHDKSDFADLLIDNGADAVRWRILEVIP